MKLICVFLLSSFVVDCIAPAGDTGSAEVAENPDLIKRNKFWNRHFVKTMITALHYGSEEKTLKEKYEMVLEALRPLLPKGVSIVSKVDFGPNVPLEQIGRDCNAELSKEMFTLWNFQKPHFARDFILLTLADIFADPMLFDPVKKIKSFVALYTYTSRVARTGKEDGWDCVRDKLCSHYQKHKDTNKEQGIEELTNEIMKFIKVIATKKEEDIGPKEMHFI